MLVNRKPGERPKRIALGDLVMLCGSPACVVCSHTQMIPASQFASNELTNYISLAAFFSRLNGPERAPGTILIIIAGVPNYKNTTKLRATRQPQLGPLMLVKLISTWLRRIANKVETQLDGINARTKHVKTISRHIHTPPHTVSKSKSFQHDGNVNKCLNIFAKLAKR